MPVMFSVSLRVMMALMAPVPSSMVSLSLRSMTGSMRPWRLHSSPRTERLHCGHLLMRPLPPRTSTMVPVMERSRPPPTFMMSSTVFWDGPEGAASMALSLLSTWVLSPMLSWGMPFQERM